MSQYLKNVFTCKCNTREYCHNTCKFWSNFGKVYCKYQLWRSIFKRKCSYHKLQNRLKLLQNLQVLGQYSRILHLQVNSFFKYWLNTWKYWAGEYTLNFVTLNLQSSKHIYQVHRILPLNLFRKSVQSCLFVNGSRAWEQMWQVLRWKNHFHASKGSLQLWKCFMLLTVFPTLAKIQLLKREINFGQFRSSETAVFSNFKGIEFC